MAAASFALFGVAVAHEPGAHVHGVAELSVVIDGERIEIGFESPLDNLLGFEHAPSSEAQKAAVRAMTAKLRAVQTLFVPTPAAHCTGGNVELDSAVLPAALLGQAEPHEKPSSAEAGDHADLDASFAFTCTVPAALKGMDVTLMQAFPGIRKLNVQVVGPSGQSSVVLGAGQRSVSW